MSLLFVESIMWRISCDVDLSKGSIDIHMRKRLENNRVARRTITLNKE